MGHGSCVLACISKLASPALKSAHLPHQAISADAPGATPVAQPHHANAADTPGATPAIKPNRPHVATKTLQFASGSSVADDLCSGHAPAWRKAVARLSKIAQKHAIIILNEHVVACLWLRGVLRKSAMHLWAALRPMGHVLGRGAPAS